MTNNQDNDFYITKKENDVQAFIEQKFQNRFKNLASKLQQRFNACIKSGKSQDQCGLQYPQSPSNLFSLQDQLNECLSQVSPPVDQNNKNIIDKCFNKYQSDIDGYFTNMLKNIEARFQ